MQTNTAAKTVETVEDALAAGWPMRHIRILADAIGDKFYTALAAVDGTAAAERAALARVTGLNAAELAAVTADIKGLL